MGTLEMQESGPRVRPFDEIGTSGLEMFSGFVQAAYDAELYWPHVGAIYSRIRRSDPEIGGIVRPAFAALSRGIKLEWEAPDEPSDDDKAAVEYGMQVLEDMEGGPDTLIDTIANYVPFMGWGWWEEVWGVRNPGWRPPDADDEWRSSYDDGLPAIRRLAWRDHASFEKWAADDKTGRVRGMIQYDYPNPSVTIPRSKSLHLTYGDPVNPEGLSPLEAVWRLERLKMGFETVMGLGYEHAAGYAKFQTTAALSADDKAAIAQAARAIMTPQKGNYIMLPGHVTADIMDGNFAAAGTLLEVVRYYGLLKLQVFAMQWSAVATTAGTGALAAHSDSSEMSLMLYNAMWEGFAHQIDQQLGRRLFEHPQVKAKFPGMTRRPRLVALPVEKSIPLNLLSQFVAQIAPIVPLDDDDLIAIRRKSGFLPESLPEVEDGEGQEEAADSVGVSEQQVLNGAQIQSALSIIDTYTQGNLPRENAVFMIQTFFNIPRAIAERMVPAEGVVEQPEPATGSPLPAEEEASEIEPAEEPEEEEPVEGEGAEMMYRAVGELLGELRASIVGAPTEAADDH